tara:strand:+ start:671 stop:946 length:276 start_codon:yes stop_codon:yes gene_type:complete
MPENLVNALVAWRELEAFFDRAPELRVQEEVDARLAELRETVDLYLPRLRVEFDVPTSINEGRRIEAARLWDEQDHDDRPEGWLRWFWRWT